MSRRLSSRLAISSSATDDMNTEKVVSQLLRRRSSKRKLVDYTQQRKTSQDDPKYKSAIKRQRSKQRLKSLKRKSHSTTEMQSIKRNYHQVSSTASATDGFIEFYLKIPSESNRRSSKMSEDSRASLLLECERFESDSNSLSPKSRRRSSSFSRSSFSSQLSIDSGVLHRSPTNKRGSVIGTILKKSIREELEGFQK